jgi:hypothetical protein
LDLSKNETSVDYILIANNGEAINNMPCQHDVNMPRSNMSAAGKQFFNSLILFNEFKYRAIPCERKGAQVRRLGSPAEQQHVWMASARLQN